VLQAGLAESAKRWITLSELMKRLELNILIPVLQETDALWSLLSEDSIDEARKELLGTLDRLRAVAQRIGWTNTVRLVDRHLSDFEEALSSKNQDSLFLLRRVFEGAILDELTGMRSFISRDDLYRIADPDNAVQFGNDASNSFPTSQPEFQEAAKCFALERWTACVFHLMRGLEPMITALAKVFKFDPSLNWQNALNEIELKVNGMGSDPSWNQQPDWKYRQEFLAQSVIHLRLVKNAWRNSTAHNRTVYTEESAKNVFEGTKAFVQDLSKGMDERGVLR
jgi:hypothetical protein